MNGTVGTEVQAADCRHRLRWVPLPGWQREICPQEATSQRRLCPLGRPGCGIGLRGRSCPARFVTVGWYVRVAEAVLAEAT